jgi:hypothetical protein
MSEETTKVNNNITLDKKSGRERLSERNEGKLNYESYSGMGEFIILDMQIFQICLYLNVYYELIFHSIYCKFAN